MALINLEAPLCTSHFRAKAQRSKNSKNESKMEVWLWRFMEDFEIDCFALRGHNSSWYTLPNAYTRDTKRNWELSCTRTQRANSHFWQKISKLKTRLEVDSRQKSCSNIFLEDHRTFSNHSLSPILKKSRNHHWSW